jgi:hypothetical protein
LLQLLLLLLLLASQEEEEEEEEEAIVVPYIHFSSEKPKPEGKFDNKKTKEVRRRRRRGCYHFSFFQIS